VTFIKIRSHRRKFSNSDRVEQKNQLLRSLQNLNGKIVVVMDNTPYHSVLAEKLPTASWSKLKLQDWLKQHKIPFGSKLTNKQLYEIIKPIRLSKRKYEIDSLLQQNSIDVLRLPPYHCHYNPIEMVWGFCKTYYNKHLPLQRSRKSEVIKNLWSTALSLYTQEMWTRSVEHCERIIDKDWEKLMGNLSFHDIPPVVISLSESDNESMSSQNLSSDDASTSSIEVACNEENQHMFDDTSNDEII
jgi:transposase